jgi:hypothetical protein
MQKKRIQLDLATAVNSISRDNVEGGIMIQVRSPRTVRMVRSRPRYRLQGVSLTKGVPGPQCSPRTNSISDFLLIV